MKVLFVILPYSPEYDENNISSKRRAFNNIPYGVMTIIKYAKDKLGEKNEFEILDLNLYPQNQIKIQLEKYLNRFNPNVVGLSLMFDTSYSYINKIAEQIKTYDKTIITLIGGASATMSYKEIVQNQDFIDALIYSEGEEPFIRFLESTDINSFIEEDKSFITKKSLLLGKLPIASKLENLDDIIDIDYKMIDFYDYELAEAFSPYCSIKGDDSKQFFLITSRGCPFKCTFCMHSAHDDKSVRYASVEKIVKHIDYMIKTYNVNTLTIYDDQILYNKKRAKEFFKQLAQFNLRIELPNGITAMFIDDELAKYMRGAGVDTVQLAIESGSKYVVHDLMKKPVKLNILDKVIGYLRKYDFWIQGFFVNGMPGELDEHRQETLNYIKKIGFDWSSFSLAYPSLGSKLYEQCIENGYIDKDVSILTAEHTNNEYIIKNPHYDAQYIIEQTYIMNLDVNFVNNYRMKIGDYSTAKKAFEDVIRRYPKQAFANFYLAQCLEYEGLEDEANEIYTNVLPKLLKEDNNWKKYFDYFGIELKKV